MMGDITALFTEEVFNKLVDQEGFEVAQCIEYLVACDTIITDETGKRRYMTADEIADTLGISRPVLIKRRMHWNENGTLDRCRVIFSGLKYEAIQTAIDRVLNHWPDIIQRIADIAIHDKNPRHVLAAAQWLQENVVSGSLTEKTVPSSEETEFLRRRRETLLSADTIIGHLKPPNTD